MMSAKRRAYTVLFAAACIRACFAADFVVEYVGQQSRCILQATANGFVGRVAQTTRLSAMIPVHDERNKMGLYCTLCCCMYYFERSCFAADFVVEYV